MKTTGTFPRLRNRAQMLAFLLAAIMCLFANYSSSAQVNTGALSGIVTDNSGAIVPNATLTVRDEATGYTRVVKTSSDGEYVFPNLPVGQYTLTVEANGFATHKVTEIINVAFRSRADFSLTVGSADQTIVVNAGTEDLSKDDASISTVIDTESIKDIPLYLRNWDDLLRTIPGVQIARYTNQSGATSSGRTGSFNVNGVHSLQNNFILDGIDNNTFSENVQELSTESAHPSVDVIKEFNVITNPYSAEYGRAPGAVVSVNSNSGSNKIHGSAYEYVRNQYFDAFDYFTKQTSKKKAEDNQNQFGGSIGGPIIRDHAFFFFNYEGTRIKQGLSRISTVPLDNERIGDFSPAAAAAAGVAPYPTIYNLSVCPKPINISTCAPPPLTNNSLAAAGVVPDAAVAKLMALFPEPNYHPNSATFPDVNNHSITAGSMDFNDSYDARVDVTASPVDTLFVRFNYFNRTRDIPGYLGGIADGSSTSAWGNQILKGASAVLGWTRVLNSRMVNDFRFGWVRDYSFAAQQPFNLNQLAGTFLPGVPANPAIGGGVPLTQFSNHSNAFVGSPDFLPKQQVPMLYQYNDTLAWTIGKHGLKIGATLYLPMRNLFQDEPGMRGDLGFTGVFSGLGTATVSGTTNARDYADGLFGATQSTQLTNVYFVDQRIWMESVFFEDDWKVTPKLTLNLGLRYDFATPVLEGKNRLANFNPAGAGSLVFAKSGSVGDRSLMDPKTTNFGPRFGVSYALGDKTVLRGGYGVYYSVFERIGSEDQLALNPPYLINKTLASNTQSVLTPAVGFPSNFLDPATINLSALQAFHIRALNPVAELPIIQQWSGGFQRQIGAWLAEADYVGTKSSHLDVIYDYNQPNVANGVNTGVAPYPNFGQVEYTSPIGFGNYNGLQASLARQMVNGLSLRAAYTYSRSLDNTPEELESNSGDPPDGRNYAFWYGPSDFDIPHRVSVSYIYEPPFGRGKSMYNAGVPSWILGNWQTSGVYTYYSGHPFQAKWGSESSLLDPYGFATAVPNSVGPVHYVKKQTCWFYSSKDAACSSAASTGWTDSFANPGNRVIGNTHRNTLRGPATDVFDAALVKHVPIHEDWNLEARWEVFNVFNHALFGQPNGDSSSGGVASITNLSGDPRVMQFAIRVNW